MFSEEEFVKNLSDLTWIRIDYDNKLEEITQFHTVVHDELIVKLCKIYYKPDSTISYNLTIENRFVDIRKSYLINLVEVITKKHLNRISNIKDIFDIVLNNYNIYINLTEEEKIKYSKDKKCKLEWCLKLK